MDHPDEVAAKEPLSRPRTKNQKQINQETLLHYESLSYFDREAVTKWIRHNLSRIPSLFNKTKHEAFKKLLDGDYHSHAALRMIRHAMKALALAD